MKLAKFVVYGALAAFLASPSLAQVTQSTPGKPVPAISSSPGAASSATKGMPAPARTSSTSALVDINSASEAELDALPGIGKSRATAIIKNRPYSGKDDLLSRHVLPPNVYNGIKDKIIARKK